MLTTCVLQIDHREETPMMFSQTFVLMPTGTGSFFCLNDVFRLSFAG